MESLYYVGMDVHKDTITLAVYRDQNRDPEYLRTMKSDSRAVSRFFEKLKEKESTILSCYEAGPTGFRRYRQLDEMHISCFVAAPTLLPRKPGDRIKTDNRDALLLAKALRNQESVPIHVPDRTDEFTRDFLRMCDEVRKELKRQKQRLMQFLLRLGVKYDLGRSY